MVTLREAVQKALADIDAMPYWNAETLERIESDLRQALAADTKPCACCGNGKAHLSVTRVCDTCGSEYAGQAEMDAAKRIEAEQQAEPFGYFKAEPFGWTDCAETDEGAVALYERPNQPAQQPLTEEKIADLFSVACRETFSGLERFIYFTRLVESFHNIK